MGNTPSSWWLCSRSPSMVLIRMTADLDGDGVVSPWEKHLCKLCLAAAVTLAFGKEALLLLP